MSDFSNVTRRKFLFTAGVSTAGSLLLKGCLGNPPSATVTATPAATAAPGPVAAGDTPETPTVKLGYIPIVESAAIIIAQAKGFFAKYGMTGVEVSKQANWASARDNVTIGSAGGGIGVQVVAEPKRTLSGDRDLYQLNPPDGKRLKPLIYRSIFLYRLE